MSNAIGSAGGSSPMMMGGMGGMGGMRRPDPSKMADDLFSKLDTKGQGYIEKSDLQGAFDQVSSKGSSGNGTRVDDVFQALDGDGDGKVTKQDMSDGIRKLAEQLDGQFQNMRMRGSGGGMGGGMGVGGGMGMMGGLSKESISGMADSSGAPEMDALLANFDTADTDHDGKISAQEALAFQDSAEAAPTSSDTQSSEARIMMQIMELAKSYGESDQYDQSNAISVAA